MIKINSEPDNSFINISKTKKKRKFIDKNEETSINQSEFIITHNLQNHCTKIGFFNTPDIKKHRIVEELEMRKTYKMKPPLIFSRLPAVFEMPKSNAYFEIDFKDKNKLNSNEKTNNKYDRNNLEPIKHIALRRNIKIVSNNQEETKQKRKLQLKPIEIKDPRKCLKNEALVEKVFINNQDRDKNTISLEKLSKTSEFYFKILENVNVDEIQVIKIGENLNLNIDLNRKQLNKKKFEKKLSNNLSAIDIKKDKNQKLNFKYEEFLSISKKKIPFGFIKKLLHVPSLKIYVSYVIIFLIYTFSIYNVVIINP
jgi:hypothetical protein